MAPLDSEYALDGRAGSMRRAKYDDALITDPCRAFSASKRACVRKKGALTFRFRCWSSASSVVLSNGENRATPALLTRASIKLAAILLGSVGYSRLAGADDDAHWRDCGRSQDDIDQSDRRVSPARAPFPNRPTGKLHQSQTDRQKGNCGGADPSAPGRRLAHGRGAGNNRSAIFPQASLRSDHPRSAPAYRGW